MSRESRNDTKHSLITHADEKTGDGFSWLL